MWYLILYLMVTIYTTYYNFLHYYHTSYCPSQP